MIASPAGTRESCEIIWRTCGRTQRRRKVQSFDKTWRTRSTQRCRSSVKKTKEFVRIRSSKRVLVSLRLFERWRQYECASGHYLLSECAQLATDAMEQSDARIVRTISRTKVCATRLDRKPPEVWCHTQFLNSDGLYQPIWFMPCVWLQPCVAYSIYGTCATHRTKRPWWLWLP